MSLFIYFFAFFSSFLLAEHYSSYFLRLSKNGVLIGKKKELLYSLIIILIPLLLACLREGIGIDYENYVGRFQLYNALSFSQYIDGMSQPEIFSYLFTKFGYSIFGSYQGVFATYSILTFVFFSLSIIERRTDLYIPLAFLVFLLNYYSASFNIVRQLLAVSIVFYSLKFIESKSFIKYLICVILVSLIHFTALITALFYPILSDKKIIRYGVILISILIPILFQDILGMFSEINELSHYSAYELENTNVLPTLILRIIIIIPLLYNYKKIVSQNPNYKLFYYLLLLDLVFVYLGSLSKWTFRFSYYTMISHVVLIPKMYLTVLKKNKCFVFIYYASFYIIQFILLYYILGRDGIFPYQSILS